MERCGGKQKLRTFFQRSNIEKLVLEGVFDFLYVKMSNIHHV